jgi:dolichol-phosphate mannosyltransferase
MNSVTVVLPTYKEFESLPSLIEKVEVVRDETYPDLKLIVVDDDSDDGTEQLIADLGKEWIELVVRTEDRGLSPAVIAGLKIANSEYCVVMDADGSHPASAIPSMIEKLETGADFVIGSRYVDGGTTEDGWGVLRWVNSKVATLMARPFTSTSDPMSGFLAFRRETFKNATDLNPVGYKIGLELIVKCCCKNVAEVPIHFRTRQLGESKLTLLVQCEYLQHIVRLLRFTHPKLVSFITFGSVGLSGAVVYLIALSVTASVFDTRWLAIVLAIWIAMSWNFIWDRRFAFWYARKRSIFSHYIGFVMVCSVGALVNFYVTNSFQESNAIVVAGFWGVLFGSTIGIIFNYFVSRLLVFKK